MDLQGLQLETAAYLQRLEIELLTKTTRKDAKRLSVLLADGFREFGSSGSIYSKQDIIATLQQEAGRSISALDFRVVFLTAEVALVTYRSLHEGSISALRSSVWKKSGEDWQMVFHQGTKLP